MGSLCTCFCFAAHSLFICSEHEVSSFQLGVRALTLLFFSLRMPRRVLLIFLVCATGDRPGQLVERKCFLLKHSGPLLQQLRAEFCVRDGNELHNLFVLAGI